MSNINHVILTGNLTRDPDCKYNGQVCERASFGIAVNRKWRDKAGEQKQDTTFQDPCWFVSSTEKGQIDIPWVTVINAMTGEILGHYCPC